MPIRVIIIAIFTTIIGLACAHGQYVGPNPEQCRELVDIAEKLTVVIADVATEDESKQMAVEMSVEIAAEIARLGCSYAPEAPQPE